jgi:uncharacterized protein
MLVDSDELVITDLILYEVGNRMSSPEKKAILTEFIEDASSKLLIIHSSENLFDKAFSLFKRNKGKNWGLVDCASFTVMREVGMVYALTADEHFDQAGFVAVLNQIR